MSKQAGVSIGMMDQAYFVGRKAILQWLNDLLLTDFKKVEETANGTFFKILYSLSLISHLFYHINRCSSMSSAWYHVQG